MSERSSARVKLAVLSKQMSELGEQTDKQLAQYLHPNSPVLFKTSLRVLSWETAPVDVEYHFKITRAKIKTPFGFAINAVTAQWVETMKSLA